MLKILVTYAVQGEFVELKWPDIEPYYIRTRSEEHTSELQSR